MCYSLNPRGSWRHARLVLVGWLVAAAVPAHAWQTAVDGAIHGADAALSVAVDGAGDVVATGFTEDMAPRLFAGSFPVIKYDGATGAIVWRHDVDGTNNGFGDQGNKVVVAPNGDAIAAGYATNNDTFFDFTVVRLAGATGDVVWRSDVNGMAQGGSLTYDQARAVTLDGNGDVLAAGGLMETGTFITSDFAVVKLAGGSGAELWRATLNGPTDDFEDYANAIAVDGAGNAIATGIVKKTEFEPLFTVAKFDGASGALRWRSEFQGGYQDYAYDVAVDPSGDAVAVGKLREGFVVKVRGTDGSTAWQRTLSGTASETSDAYAVRVDASGDVYVVGDAFDVFSGGDLVVWKLAGADGHELWRREVTTVGSTYGVNDYGYAIALDGAGSVGVAGTLGNEPVVVRLRASDGTELMRHVLPPASGNGYGSLGAVAFDPAGDLVAAGSAEDEATGTEHDFFVAKVAGDGPVEGSGNGVVEAPEWCDDGNASLTDACLPGCLPNLCVDGVALVDAKFKMRHGTASFQGRLKFGPGGVPGGFAPELRGMQLLVDTLGNLEQTRWIDLTTVTNAIPPEAAGSCGPTDGWIDAGRRETYRNDSGAVDPPACTAGSSGGIVSLRLDDRSSTGQGVRVKAQLRGLATVPSGPLRVSVVLGGSTADATNGVCGIAYFPLGRCRNTTTSYRCS